MIIQITLEALHEANIAGVEIENITEETPNDVRDTQETRIIVFERESGYTSIGDDVDEAGMYRTEVKIRVIALEKETAKSICLQAARIVQRKFESLRFTTPCFRGVEKSDKSVGRPGENKFLDMFFAERTLIVINSFEP